MSATALANGSDVEVQGTVLTSAGELVATHVEVLPSLGAAANQRADIEGIITSFSSAANFALQGQNVTTDTNTNFVLHGIALGVDVEVDVQGTFNAAGVLLAQKVEVRPGSSSLVRGLVDSVTATRCIESSILDFTCEVLYTRPMNLSSIGYLIAQQRRAKGLTLTALASSAGVGRSTLAALESGKLPELGFVKVARLCDAVGLVLEARPLELDTPLMPHRHLTEAAGRDLTKAAIEDVVVRGDIAAWRGLVRAIHAHQQGGLASRVQQVVAALDRDDPKVRAFATLLPDVLRRAQPDSEHA